MTINRYASSAYLSTLSSSMPSTAAQALTDSSAANGTAAATKSPMRGVGRPDDGAREAAKAKLQATDPALAKKMEDFHKQIDSMREGGASKEDIQKTMKSNMDSLSDTEKTELSSIFGKPPTDRSQGSDPLSKLKESDPTLAKKLEDLQTQMDSLKKSGASDDAVQSAMKSVLESLSDTEKSEVADAFSASKPPPPPSSAKAAPNSYQRAQFSAAYAQATPTSGMALAA